MGVSHNYWYEYHQIIHLKQDTMGIPIQNTHVYSLNFAVNKVLIAQDHDDMEFMARKLKEE